MATPRPFPNRSGERGQTTREMVMMSAAVAIILVCVFFMVWNNRSHSSKGTVKFLTALGQGTAEETARLLHDSGQLVVVTSTELQQAGTPAFEEWEAFREEMAKHPAIQLIIPPAVILVDSNFSRTLPRENFDDLLARYPRATALLSLIGLPSITDPKPLELPSPAPRIIAVFPAAPDVPDYFHKSILTMAITPKPGVTAPPTLPRTAREVFTQFYQVYTADNYQTIPE